VSKKMPKNVTFSSKRWQKLKFQYFYLVLVHTIATHSQIKRKFFFFGWTGDPQSWVPFSYFFFTRMSLGCSTADSWRHIKFIKFIITL